MPAVHGGDSLRAGLASEGIGAGGSSAYRAALSTLSPALRERAARARLVVLQLQDGLCWRDAPLSGEARALFVRALSTPRLRVALVTRSGPRAVARQVVPALPPALRPALRAFAPMPLRLAADGALRAFGGRGPASADPALRARVEEALCARFAPRRLQLVAAGDDTLRALLHLLPGEDPALAAESVAPVVLAPESLGLGVEVWPVVPGPGGVLGLRVEPDLRGVMAALMREAEVAPDEVLVVLSEVRSGGADPGLAQGAGARGLFVGRSAPAALPPGVDPSPVAGPPAVAAVLACALGGEPRGGESRPGPKRIPPGRTLRRALPAPPALGARALERYGRAEGPRALDTALQWLALAGDPRARGLYAAYLDRLFRRHAALLGRFARWVIAEARSLAAPVVFLAEGARVLHSLARAAAPRDPLHAAPVSTVALREPSWVIERFRANGWLRTGPLVVVDAGLGGTHPLALRALLAPHGVDVRGRLLHLLPERARLIEARGEPVSGFNLSVAVRTEAERAATHLLAHVLDEGIARGRGSVCGFVAGEAVFAEGDAAWAARVTERAVARLCDSAAFRREAVG